MFFRAGESLSGHIVLELVLQVPDALEAPATSHTINESAPHNQRPFCAPHPRPTLPAPLCALTQRKHCVRETGVDAAAALLGGSRHSVRPTTSRRRSEAAVEQICHIQDSQGQILALGSLVIKVCKPFQVVPSSLGSLSRRM